MTMYQRRRMSKSPYIRYDKSQGLWIQHRKVVYLYWYKFLQHAERDDRYNVDWSRYESWGGRETVMETKFDVWWKEYWRDLFGFPEGKPETAKLGNEFLIDIQGEKIKANIIEEPAFDPTNQRLKA